MYLQLKWQFPVCYLGLSLPLRKTVRVQMVLSDGKVKGQMFVLFFLFLSYILLLGLRLQSIRAIVTHISTFNASFEGSRSTFALPLMPAVQTQRSSCPLHAFGVRGEPYVGSFQAFLNGTFIFLTKSCLESCKDGCKAAKGLLQILKYSITIHK